MARTNNCEANLVNYDWDDTELIRAYDEGMKLRKSLENGTLPKTKKSSKGKSTSKQWKVGDFCKALYAEDNQYYEARIESLDGDYCVVEYYGYNESAEVSLQDLKSSDGKNARKKQQRLVFTGEKEFTSASETCEESNNVSYRRSYVSKKRMNDSCSMNHGAYDTTHHETTMNETAPFNHSTMGPYFPPNNAPCMPTALPMPQCPNMTSNPALQNMLVAWYMAGYYSGIHQGQKGCSQQCSMQRCSHSNQCCHH